MDKIDKMGIEISNYNGFIINPYSFIYDTFGDVTTSELIEILKFISVHNRDVIISRKEQVIKLREELSSNTVVPIVKNESKKEVISFEEDKAVIKNVSDIVDVLFFCNSNEEILSIMESRQEDNVLIKLELLKRINSVKKAILEKIRYNPLTDVRDLQEELQRYEIVLECLKSVIKNEEEKTSISFNNIVFVPNGSSLYITDDIVSFEERYHEIKNIVDKIVDGYFLKTKDIKKLESYKNLFEYRHPNGIRVLFVIEGNVMNICSLFFKDKQRSIRITNEYEEAIKRYNLRRDYIMENIDNPDFIIEQGELIGSLYSLFEVRVLAKKVGE